jgi:hypothetical protein
VLAGAVCAAMLLGAPDGDPDPLAAGYHDMYNLKFADAHRTFEDYQHANPADPMGPVSDAAAYLFFEFERLKILHSEFFADNSSFFSKKKLAADPQVKRDFEAALAESKKRADAMLQKNANARDALLANVIRIALQALTEVKQARADADALVKKYPDCYDAYLAMGVENYLLSQKAAPIRVFLRMTGAETDKEQGLIKLRIVADKGHYLKPYAKILLAIAALRDNRKPEAVKLLQELAAQFPRNDLFQEELKKLS